MGVVSGPSGLSETTQYHPCTPCAPCMQISVIFRDEQRGVASMQLKLGHPLYTAMCACCDRRQVAPLSIMFVFRGERIEHMTTPAELGLCDGDVIDTVVVDINMGSLITQLSSTSAMQQERAAWALGNLANVRDNVSAIAEAIPLLVLQLDSNSTAVQSAAVTALAGLSAQSPVLRAAAAGAIPRVVLLLESASVKVQKAAACALGSHAQDTGSSRSIVAAGAIPLLVQLLGSGSTGVQEGSAFALDWLAAQTECQASLVLAGAIPALVQFLRSIIALGRLTVPLCKIDLGHALGALHLLSHADRGNLDRMASAGAIPLLVQLLSGFYGHQWEAARLLHLLAMDDAAGTRVHQVSIVAAGAIPALVRLMTADLDPPLSASISTEAEAAAKIVSLLATHTGNHDSLVEGGALPAIVGLLGSRSGKDAAYSLYNLLLSNSMAAASAAHSALSVAAADGVKFAESQNTLTRLSISPLQSDKRAAKTILDSLERAAAAVQQEQLAAAAVRQQQRVSAHQKAVQEAERLADELIAEEEAEKAKISRKKSKKKAGKTKGAAAGTAAAVARGTCPSGLAGVSRPSASNAMAADATTLLGHTAAPDQPAPPVPQPAHSDLHAAPQPVPPAARPLPAASPSEPDTYQPAPSPAPPPPAPPPARIPLPPTLQHLSVVGPRPAGLPSSRPPPASFNPVSCEATLPPSGHAAPMVQLGAAANPIVAGPVPPYRPVLWGSSSATARGAAPLGATASALPHSDAPPGFSSPSMPLRTTPAIGGSAEDDDKLCVVCMEGAASVLLTPCGHTVLCQRCCEGIRGANNQVGRAGRDGAVKQAIDLSLCLGHTLRCT